MTIGNMQTWGVIVCLAALAGIQVFAGEPLAFPEDVRGLSSARIVSGWDAEEGQIPWQLSMRMVNPTGGVNACGGSIIHPEWGITAAHCTATRITMVLRAGAVSLTRPELLFETTEYWNHPLYIDALQTVVQPNDIAILKFPQAIPFSDRVQPIRLQRDQDKDRNYDGIRLEASGWGRTWTDGDAPDQLQWVYLTGESNLACWFAFGGSSIIVDSTICASAYNVSSQSTCSGDSGGPLVELGEDGKYTLVGIASFVSGTGCHTAFPAGFIRPGYYHSWYTEVTGIDFSSWEYEADSSSESASSESDEDSEETTEEPTTEAASSSESNEDSDETTEEPTTEAPSSSESNEDSDETTEEPTTESASSSESNEDSEETTEEPTTEAASSSESNEDSDETTEEPTTESASSSESNEDSEETTEEPTTEAASSSESNEDSDETTEEPTTESASSSESNEESNETTEEPTTESTSSSESNEESNETTEEPTTEVPSSSESNSNETNQETEETTEAASTEEETTEAASEEEAETTEEPSNEDATTEETTEAASEEEDATTEASAEDVIAEKSVEAEDKTSEATSEENAVEESRNIFSYFRGVTRF